MQHLNSLVTAVAKQNLVDLLAKKEVILVTSSLVDLLSYANYISNIGII